MEKIGNVCLSRINNTDCSTFINWFQMIVDVLQLSFPGIETRITNISAEFDPEY